MRVFASEDTTNRSLGGQPDKEVHRWSIEKAKSSHGGRTKSHDLVARAPNHGLWLSLWLGPVIHEDVVTLDLILTLAIGFFVKLDKNNILGE